MEKDIPEIELKITSSEIYPKSKRLKREWKCHVSNWSMWVDGVYGYAMWTNHVTGEKIEVDYETALAYMCEDPVATAELRSLLPEENDE